MVHFKHFAVSVVLTTHNVRIMYEPVLSEKSSQQHRNVFIWCGRRQKIAMGRCFWYQFGSSDQSIDNLTGLHVDTDSPPNISTVHRWIMTIVQTEAGSEASSKPQLFALFPVVIRPAGVLLYDLKQSGSALARESQESIAPGHYGIYNQGRNRLVPKYVWRAQNDCRWLTAK